MVQLTRKGMRNRRVSIPVTLPSIILVGLFGFWFIAIFFMHTTSTRAGGEELSSPDQNDRIRASKKEILVVPEPQKKYNARPALANKDGKIVIGYAVSVTGCGSDPIAEGAAVLKHSIHLASASSTKYDYKMYAIIHPQAMECSSDSLEALGYTILQRDVPVPVHEIEGEYLRTRVEKNGCCGEKEFIKLHAYTLVEHPVIVHLDLDTLILKPLDPLFDAMISGDTTNVAPDIMWKDRGIPMQIDAFYTRDYNMVNPKSGKRAGVQGGFLVLRPGMNAYSEFEAIIRKGDFRSNGGWGGQGFGPFYGSMTFQGIVPYYYDGLHPGTAAELDRCSYNQMADNPRVGRTVNNIVSGDCRDGREDCEDCRSRKLDTVHTVHYTLCQKPWLCMNQGTERIQDALCREFHHEWFRVRSSLEKSWGRSEFGPGEWNKEQFYGFCKGRGKSGYQFVQVPTDISSPKEKI